MLQTKYNKIKIAIVYHERFETERKGDWVDLCINSSTQTLEAYRKGMNSDYFINRIN